MHKIYIYFPSTGNGIGSPLKIVDANNSITSAFFTPTKTGLPPTAVIPSLSVPTTTTTTPHTVSTTITAHSASPSLPTNNTAVNGVNTNMSGILNSDCSNSSWAEMSSYIVGSYQMHPVTRDTKVLFILKYLRPVGEYQESLGHVFEYKALDLIFHYINVRNTCHARLSFEALRFLGSLLFHKKFCLEFVNRGGVQILLNVSAALVLRCT